MHWALCGFLRKGCWNVRHQPAWHVCNLMFLKFENLIFQLIWTSNLLPSIYHPNIVKMNNKLLIASASFRFTRLLWPMILLQSLVLITPPFSNAQPEGWKMTDRFLGFRYEMIGMILDLGMEEAIQGMHWRTYRSEFLPLFLPFQPRKCLKHASLLFSFCLSPPCTRCSSSQSGSTCLLRVGTTKS